MSNNMFISESKVVRTLTLSMVAAALCMVLLFSSCDKDDPEPVNEEELITTLTLTFQKLDVTGAPEGSPFSFSWEDLDGSGSGAPVIDDILLDAHSNYQLSIELSDRSKTPEVDVTAEVEEENTAHQFFYLPSANLELEVSYADVDDNGKPLGLYNLVSTDHSGTGTLTVILRHEPDKNASGVSNGDVTNANGETDVNAVFNVSIVE